MIMDGVLLGSSSMKKHSIRTRVTVGFGVLTVAILVVVDLGAYVFTRRRLLDDLDARLELCSTVLGSAVENKDGRAVLEATDAVKAKFGPGAPRFFEIWTAADHVPVEHSASIDGLLPPIGIDAAVTRLRGRGDLSKATSSWTISDVARPYRVRAAIQSGSVRSDPAKPIQPRPPEVLVVVGESLEAMSASLSHLSAGLLGGTAIAALLASGIAWWLSRNIVRPLVNVADAAQHIRLSDPSDLVPSPHTGDEIDGLVDTLNATFTRLREGFQREKRFAADASHELRTPVAIVRSQAEVALLDVRAPERVREVFEAIKDAAERMQHIIEGLLDLARISEAPASAEVGRVDLCRIAREAVETWEPDAEKKSLTLRVDCPDSVDVQGHPDQIYLALSNVLSNAIRYSDPEREIAVEIESGDEMATVRVRDEGIGIPADRVGQVFDRFYRVDEHRSRAVGGAGLGLSLVREVVKVHGGEVAIESALNRGTTVTLRFPRWNPEGHAEAGRVSPA
jgi:signal transduction histidine kinase